jgi:hypothetical protein
MDTFVTAVITENSCTELLNEKTVSRITNVEMKLRAMQTELKRKKKLKKAIHTLILRVI